MSTAAAFQIRGTQNVAKLQTAFRDLAAYTSDLRPVLTLLGNMMTRQTSQNFREQRDPVTGAPWKKTGSLALSTRVQPGGNTLSDNRHLMRSLTERRPKVTKNSVSIDTGAVKYAGIHYHGGTIKPKSARFLALPLTREAKRAKSARRWFKQAQGQWVKNEKKQPFVFRSKHGNLLIGTQTLSGSVTAHFWLVRSVSITARRYAGWGPKQTGEAETLVAGEAQKAMEKHFKQRGFA